MNHLIQLIIVTAFPALSPLEVGSLRTWSYLQEFKKDILHNLLPFVGENYHVKTKNDNRTILGFSDGGHTWMNYRLYLAKTLHQLFKD